MEKKKRKVYELTIMEEDLVSGIDSISIVSDPAIEIPFLMFSKNSKDDKNKFNFEVTDVDKQVLVGPAMLPDILIPRVDAEGEMYDVFFTKETISMIAEKYMRNGYNVANDLEHNGNRERDYFVISSWIIEDEKFDKAYKYEQYKELPLGTWMVEIKVNNKETWKEIKEGTYTGFSISGFFSQELIDMMKIKTNEEKFLEEFEKLLKKYKEDN